MQQSVSYRDAIALKYPESVVVVLARDERGRDNPITLGWSMITSSEPPMFAIAINARAYSVGAIRRSRSFVLAFPAAAQAEEAIYWGTHSGRDMDKLAATRSPVEPASAVAGSLLSEAVANFECLLESELATGDHVLFTGRVVACHRHPSADVARLYSLGGGTVGAVEPGDVRARR